MPNYKILDENGLSYPRKIQYPAPNGDKPGYWLETDEEPMVGRSGFHSISHLAGVKSYLREASSFTVGHEWAIYEVEVGGRTHTPFATNGLMASSRIRVLRKYEEPVVPEKEITITKSMLVDILNSTRVGCGFNLDTSADWHHSEQFVTLLLNEIDMYKKGIRYNA